MLCSDLKQIVTAEMGTGWSQQQPDNAIPLSPIGTSATPEEQLAAAYFGETTAKLFFGPHFITNAHVLRRAGAVVVAETNQPQSATAALARLISAPFAFWTTTTSENSTTGSGVVAGGPNLEGKLTEEELIEIARLYRQAPLGDVNLTSTLQSLTNVKKASVRMIPFSVESVQPQSESLSSSSSAPAASAKPSKHLLEFTFDASSPCIIHIYYVSKEILVQKADGTRKLAFVPKYVKSPEEDDGPPAVRTYGPFPAGLGQHFLAPEADAFDMKWFASEELAFGAKKGLSIQLPAIERTSDARSEQVGVDIPSLEVDSTDGEEASQSKADLLLSGETMYYPLVIVMEALEDGVEQDQTFRESNERSVNIQITYASLLETKETHNYTVKVLKQKALIDGTPYLLHDIYGFTDPTGTGASNPNLRLGAEDLQTMRECVVCMSELKDTIVLPCRHLCLCHSCGETLRMQGRNANGSAVGGGVAPKCPICRQTFESLLQINLPAPFRKSGGGNGGGGTTMSLDPVRGSTATLLPHGNQYQEP
ncbi:hypothetical protein BC830DRAFT_1148324 [Chytriomyces sp. MP71]|nr:hypothetical protein BC830DRAFT_1148324 [Chytriomyces sp. MP71]